MTIEDLIYTHLRDDTALAALISGRVYPMLLPQGEPLPAIVFQAISNPRDHTHGGPSGMVDSRYQVTAWGGKAKDGGYETALAVIHKVRLAMNLFRGAASGAVRVEAVFTEGGSDNYDDELKIFGRDMDFIVQHTEEAE